MPFLIYKDCDFYHILQYILKKYILKKVFTKRVYTISLDIKKEKKETNSFENCFFSKSLRYYINVKR